MARVRLVILTHLQPRHISSDAISGGYVAVGLDPKDYTVDPLAAWRSLAQLGISVDGYVQLRNLDLPREWVQLQDMGRDHRLLIPL